MSTIDLRRPLLALAVTAKATATSRRPCLRRLCGVAWEPSKCGQRGPRTCWQGGAADKRSRRRRQAMSSGRIQSLRIMLREFDAELHKGDNPGAWTCVVMDDAAELFGTFDMFFASSGFVQQLLLQFSGVASATTAAAAAARDDTPSASAPSAALLPAWAMPRYRCTEQWAPVAASEGRRAAVHKVRSTHAHMLVMVSAAVVWWGSMLTVCFENVRSFACLSRGARRGAVGVQTLLSDQQQTQRSPMHLLPAVSNTAGLLPAACNGVGDSASVPSLCCTPLHSYQLRHVSLQWIRAHS